VRGEYKVPGGKLVAADVEVVDGTLAQVSVSGDFFLEPDAALGVIDAALTGRPADARVADLTTAIEDALHRAEHDGTLDTPVEMIGFSAESVAIAVRRALGHATGWQDHTFEVIHPGPLPPAVLGALDQVLTEELAAGRRGPTLRFWEWEERAVFIGSFQSLRNEVDPEGVAKHDVTVVRRISGGGAMFMEAGNCITFSLVVPASLVDGLSFEQSYRFLDDWVIGALAEVGVRASFAGLNDVASPAGKIAGSAQKRLRHRRGQDARGAADRPREAVRQGHHQREQARRPGALADRPAPGEGHRGLRRVLPLPLPRGGRRAAPRGAGPRRAAGHREVRQPGVDRARPLRIRVGSGSPPIPADPGDAAGWTP
jgi:lipoate-protein ligase A